MAHVCQHPQQGFVWEATTWTAHELPMVDKHDFEIHILPAYPQVLGLLMHATLSRLDIKQSVSRMLDTIPIELHP